MAVTSSTEGTPKPTETRIERIHPLDVEGDFRRRCAQPKSDPQGDLAMISAANLILFRLRKRTRGKRDDEA